MSGFRDSIRYNLGRLRDISGRETRSQFWPYAATVVALSIVGGWVVTIPILLAGMAMLDRADSFEQALRQMALVQDVFLLATIGWCIVIVGLLGAAIVRRLHDRSMQGRWALLPVPFIIVGLGGVGYFGHAMNDAQMFDMRLFMAMFVNNIIYVLTLLFLIVHLALKGSVGPNRYGPEPAVGPPPA